MSLRTIQFTIRGKPMPYSIGTTGGGGKVRRWAKHKPWQDSVAGQAQPYAPEEPWEGAVSLTMSFFMPKAQSAPKHPERCKSLRRKARAMWPTGIPDLGKLARVIEDALQGEFYRNDSQVVQQVFIKQYGPAWWTEVTVEFMEDGNAQPT